MSQSQDATFTAPMGEENLMNINHRDSESITESLWTVTAAMKLKDACSLEEKL